MRVEELRTLSVDTIPDAIGLMNESSRGTSSECHMDFFSFLVFRGYWNISFAHSMICYVDGTAAAITLVCTDGTTLDAYILYWGAIPRFRTLRIARSLFEACCNKLSEDGYQMLYGLSVPDRAVKRYRFIQALPQFRLFDLRSEAPTVMPSDPAIRVQPIDLDSVSSLSIPRDECIEWSQRLSFLRRVALSLKFFGAFAGDVLKAYAIIRPEPSGTATLIDLRCSESDLAWGRALLDRGLIERCPRPYVATHVADQSYGYRLLTAAGFHVTRQIQVLTRDLRTTCSISPVRSL